MFNPQHMDALGVEFAKVYTVTKQNPPSNIFDSRFKRSPMGAEQSRSATQRKPRRASTGETNVLIPPPPNIKISSVLEIDVVLFLVFAYSSDDSNLKCSCKRFQHISRTLNIFRCIERYDMVTLRKILTQSSQSSRLRSPETRERLIYSGQKKLVQQKDSHECCENR